ncbi:MAG: metallophosphoesterase [Oscillospiraceae bacterium]|jgi:hypothetical protein|nr:metallophosphoesterase [Oscillospiraceae bacterium]
MADFFEKLIATITAAIMTWYVGIGGALVIPVKVKMNTAPVVFDVGEENYAIMWHTNTKGTGSVTINVKGEEKTYWDATSGTINSKDTLHVVKIKKAILDEAKSYQVHSEFVLFSVGYFAIKGPKVSSESYNFKPYDPAQNVIRALSVADIHGEHSNAEAATKVLLDDAGAPADFVILNGDISRDWLLTQNDFVDEILVIAQKLSKSGIPVIYARGNHETRGQWATEMIDYFPTDTGHLYFETSYGPIKMLVLDTGEDKPDDHYEYAGLADFATYLAEERAWIENLKKDENESIQYRFTISHKHNIDTEFGENWTIPLVPLGTQFIFCGHGHHNSLRAADETGIPFFEDGGQPTASLITFKDGDITAKTAYADGALTDWGDITTVD